MTSLPHGTTRLDILARTQAGPDRPFSRNFGRLFPENPLTRGELSHAMIVDCLDALADSMRADGPENGPADAGMTFFGQFVDHDITRDAASALGTRIDPATIANVRTPALDLDSVYGDGPSASPHLYGAGRASDFLMFGRRGNPLDFARTCAGKALIGDPRNDENIILAQIHGAFVCLHNILMTLAQEPGTAAREISEIGQAGLPAATWRDLVPPGLRTFEEVRRFARLHYQWIVWNEFLPAVVDQQSLSAADTGIFPADAPVMPIEFSGAAYRFGHATVQPQYRLRAGAAVRDLFQTAGFGARPFDANLQFDQFFQMRGAAPAQTSRPVAPRVAAPLFALPFIGDPVPLGDTGVVLDPARARKLPLRNLLRDRYTYQLASGQMVAGAMGLTPLAPPPALHAAGLTQTPLWYYVLQEAEAHGRGRLCGAGGAIVAAVFDNLLSRDPGTYRHAPGFAPWSGFDGEPTVLAGMLKFVETHRGNVAFADRLICG